MNRIIIQFFTIFQHYSMILVIKYTQIIYIFVNNLALKLY